MPYPRAFYRTVTTLSRPQGFDSAARRIEVDLADLDFGRPEEALEALRRVVAQARNGERLSPAPKAPPHRRHLEAGVEQALAVYSRH
jgi:hypothetical protein